MRKTRLFPSPMPLLVFILLIGSVVAGPAASQTVLRVDRNAVGLDDGSSWPDAFADLQDALAVAAEIPGTVEIWVVANTYLPDYGGFQHYDITRSFELSGNVHLLGGFAGNETAANERDPAANLTILSGDLIGNDFPNWLQRYDNSLHVVTARDQSATSVIDGFVIRAGNADFEGSDLLGGGGVFVQRAHLEIRRCTFTENVSGDTMPGVGNFGAAIYVKDSGSVTIDECRFIRNRANTGGAIGGLQSDDGEPIDILIMDTLFGGNYVPTQHGGAILFHGRSLRILRCDFRDNTAGYGGVISATNCEQIVIRDCTFDNNIAHTETSVLRLDRCDNFDTTPAVIERCTFTDNWAGGGFRGGTIHLINTITHMSHCDIRGGYNLRFDELTGLISGAGTIFVDRNSGHRFDNCLLADNFTAIVGGIILSNCTAEFVNCTLVNNRAAAIDPAASGIAAFGSIVSVDNTILWGNRFARGKNDDLPGTAGEFAQLSVENSILSINHTDLEGWSGLHGGTGNIGDDPQFVDEPNLDLRVLSSSPVIDAGDDSAVPFELFFDLDGEPRITDGDDDKDARVDMGAYESPGMVVSSIPDLPSPSKAMLGQNYPNPFNPTTTIRYEVARPGDVTLRVYDARGAFVADLYSGVRQPGGYDARWDGRNHRGERVASGVYFYRLSTPDRIATKKMILLK